ncbi:MAG: precorrin-6y C5,15-methyltransferase (decarboxylating) subunit CbiE [Bacillota bacterium]|nr:precorrin-6y C5,15-methyltransferase (decarboxylating) subunit CbiE [Bacillota bacterium]
MEKKAGTNMNNKVRIIGIGPGASEFISPEADKIIKKSHIIVGGKRNLEVYSSLDCEKVPITSNLEEIAGFIEENKDKKLISVLASGDPGMYGILEYLKRKHGDLELEVIPGISSFQYLCAKMKISWHDACITSLHGRERHNLIDLIKNNKKTIIFTGGTSTPADICRSLISEGLTELTITVGEKLSYPDERIFMGSPEEICSMDFHNLSIMLIQNEGQKIMPESLWSYATYGIPDEMFIRGEVPMTKEEIRTVAVSKLRLKEDSVVYDIGAGTGSVSVECGLICVKGRVFAVEKETDAICLIEENINKFGAKNVKIIQGEAPEVLKGLPEPDCVFIGGSGGRMEKILDWVKSCSRNVRIVISAVTIESAYEAVKGLEDGGACNADIVCLSVSRGRKLGGKHLMQALNPVYIISGECGGQT